MEGFAFGIAPDDGKPLDLLTPAEWKTIVESKSDQLKWDGERVPIRLMVELPFWLMIPNSEISVSHELTTVLAGIMQNFFEVSHGPIFHDSHAKVVYVGPGDGLTPGRIPPAIADLRPVIVLSMKTVIVFQPDALK